MNRSGRDKEAGDRSYELTHAMGKESCKADTCVVNNPEHVTLNVNYCSYFRMNSIFKVRRNGLCGSGGEMGSPLLARMQPLSKVKSHPQIPDAHPLRRLDDPAHFIVHAHPLSLSMLHNALLACVISRIAHQRKQITHQVWHLSSKNIRIAI